MFKVKNLSQESTLKSDLPSRSHMRFGKAAAILLSGACLTMTSPALAVDLQPVQTLDSNGVGKIVRGDLLAPGIYKVGIHARGDVSPIPNQVYEEEFVDNRAVLERINRQTVSFGLGLTEYLDLSISAHASSEYTGLSFQDKFDFTETKSGEAWKFAGASALMKARLIKDGNFSISIAPFFESGSGEQKPGILSRSVDPKLGWMGILNYGEEGLAKITMNAGYRYRYGEQVGQLKLRNELFYQGMLEGYLSRNLSVFAGGQGRLLMLNRGGEVESDGKLKFEPFESSEMSVGFNGKLGSLDLSVYGGSRLQARAIGFGKHFVGMNVTYALGERKRSYSQKIEIAERKKQSPETLKPKEDIVDRDTYLNQFVDKDIENFKADAAFTNVFKELPSSHEDEFRALEKRRALESQQPSKPVLSEDELIERELEALRLAEKRQQAAAEKRQQMIAEMERQSGRKIMEQRHAQEREYLHELREQIDALPTISEEEALWNGLED